MAKNHSVDYEHLETRTKEMMTLSFKTLTNQMAEDKSVMLKMMKDNYDRITSFEPKIQQMLVRDDLNKNIEKTEELKRKMLDEFE
jgi:hypothetical protein